MDIHVHVECGGRVMIEQEENDKVASVLDAVQPLLAKFLHVILGMSWLNLPHYYISIKEH